MSPSWPKALRDKGTQRILRSYLPIAIVGLAFLMLGAVVPPVERETQTIAAPGPGGVVSGPALTPEFTQQAGDKPGKTGTTQPGTPGPATGPGSPSGPADGSGGPTDPTTPGATAAPGTPGDTAAPTATVAPGTPGVTTAPTVAGPGPAQPPQPTNPRGGVSPCADRSEQVPGDPYTPPCIAFTGPNGGSTYKGVTEDEIIVSIRQLEGPSAAEIFSDISGQSVNDSEEAVVDTLEALGEYFSERFQFYGRKIRFEFFKGKGQGSAELLGGGMEAALSDATRVAQEIGAFADLSGITIPYADALARQGVVNVGSPYPSREWFVERRPYSWSLFPDGTNVVESAVSWVVARLKGQNTAEYAGPSLRGQPRKYGIVAPENADYQQSVERYIELLEAEGFEIALNMKYKLDINSMPNQASNIVAQLKDAGITSVMCACDPVMLALGMAPKANEQGYEPEWITSGLAFVDQDMVSQLIEPGQWGRAFGIAYNAESEPQGASFPYAAYKQMRPNDEPAFGVEEMYYSMYIFALGVHLAGPNLTPETFEAGLFSYPGGQGPRGAWGFGEGDYTPTDDFREIWWDPNRISPQNNKEGAWVQLGGGARYFPGQVPHESGAFFQ